MDTLEVIYNRRSIRKFTSASIPGELIHEIVNAGMRAPSGMNRQPWRFVVVEGKAKEGLVEIMLQRALDLKKARVRTGSYENTLGIIKKAPAVILAFNAGLKHKLFDSQVNRFIRLMDIQSIGAAIQTMALAAQNMGLGTLWMCDVFYAERQIRELLHRNEELVAALAVGYAAEFPNPRPRKNADEVVEWK